MKHKYLIVIAAMTLLMTSCKNSADVDRAIETFFIFVIQIISFGLLGISSLVLCIVGKTLTPKVIGGILLGLFIFVTVSCFIAINEINPKRDYIYFAFFIDAIIIGISIFFLIKPTAEKTNINANYLEKIDEPNLIHSKSEDMEKIDEPKIINSKLDELD